MRLSRPFFQLPVLFDAPRLQAEVMALPAEAWAPHPSRILGNSAVRLITPGGGETDAIHGQMAPTRWVGDMPYLRQVLADFGVVWSRSRLMRIAPGGSVPEHVDVDYHWHTRVRLHIPIITWPQVRFHCGGQSVHMGTGEAWIFDNWRPHRVENEAAGDRIHLVADTTGTAAFWQLACGPAPPREQWRTVAWNPAIDPQLLTECDQRLPVMPAAEVQRLVDDLRGELIASDDTPEAGARAAELDALLEGFVLDWRQLCARHGVSGRGRQDFLSLADTVREATRRLGHGLGVRANHVPALAVIDRVLLQHLVVDDIELRGRPVPTNA